MNNDSFSNGDINESEFFEENDLYIEGNKYIESIKKNFEDFNKIENELFKGMNLNNNNLSVDDIMIKNLEKEVEDIIETKTKELIYNKKKNIFVLDNKKEENDLNDENIKKGNYLRNEAKVLENTIKDITLPTYHEIKNEKFKDCDLNSYYFFKNFCKKEVGKENNYIFNYRDNFLNDMTKIDHLFFKDFFKPKETISEDIILIYDFSVYHPTKNIKTQQISILSDGKLIDLKNKIYCVLDEIQKEPQRSFFFIENVFYNDISIINKDGINEFLSQKISENRLRNLTFKDQISSSKKHNNEKGNNELTNDYSKFNYYDKLNYCTQNIIIKNKINSYENLDMNIYIKDIPMRIGYPYLFRHVEYCDHMILLNDIRVMDKYDNFDKDEKAMVTFQKKIKRRKCDACMFYYAKFISINDIAMGDVSHALFLCDYCLRKLHENDLNEKNTSNLKIIPYFHD